MEKAEIVAALRELSSLLELRGGNRFKVKAFARGARSLEASREPIERLVEERRLAELPGIGVALAKQIEELHRTGTSELLASLRRGLPSGVLELAQIAGIGLHALETLHAELGIASVDDLRAAAEAGRLRGVKGFGEKKEAQLLRAIAKYETSSPKVLLSDGLRLAASLEDELAALGRVTLAGTLRRGHELSSGVDLVLAGKDPAELAARVASHPRFSSRERRDLREDSAGDTEARLRLPDGTRVRVLACAPDAFAATSVLASSAPEHAEWLRARATDVGLELRDDGLFDRGRRVPLEDEEALYARLHLAYVPPELREGPMPRVPDLVAIEDIRGFVHCHTTWSDGKHSIEEMSRAAEARGAAFLTITDHSRTAHYAGGLDVDDLLRQWDEIDAVQERVRIRILKGTEADILADGALDWPDAILERLDVVIASIHNRYKQDEDAMTARLLRAMEWPVFKIWGHPLGRLVTSRPPIPCRVEEVLDRLARSRGAIEINGDPHRLDLEPRWCRAAKERGLSFVLSVDAHATRELDNLRYAVTLARRSGLGPDDVLNTHATSAFARAVRPVTPPRRAAPERARPR